MEIKEAEEFMDWLWEQIKQEPELAKALDQMEGWKVRRLEDNALTRLRRWY